MIIIMIIIMIIMMIIIMIMITQNNKKKFGLSRFRDVKMSRDPPNTHT